MSLTDGLLAHLVPFALVTARLGGLFMFAPLLSGPAVPIKVRAMLAVMASLAVYPGLMADGLAQSQPLSLFGVAPFIAAEALIGAAIGLLASIPLVAVQTGGHVMGYQMGLGIASVYNPEMDTQSDAVGELVFYLAVAAFLSMGGMELLFSALVGSFASLPPGAAAVQPGALELATGLAASGFDLALRVAAPVTGIIMLLMLAMGFIMKTMPQINVLSVGFAIKIIVGLIVLGLALRVLDTVIRDELSDGLGMVVRWAIGRD
ncbi:MAG: flagellar biosynthetic protein FliR [Phycisphaeraceae bacterium]|nr:flagellar biosynthetic protein FliR [Phycisphaeraceae bacterium]